MCSTLLFSVLLKSCSINMFKILPTPGPISSLFLLKLSKASGTNSWNAYFCYTQSRWMSHDAFKKTICLTPQCIWVWFIFFVQLRSDRKLCFLSENFISLIHFKETLWKTGKIKSKCLWTEDLLWLFVLVINEKHCSIKTDPTQKS